VFGRGNQQLSPRVIRQVSLGNVVVVATESKMRSVKTLRVDTGDMELDAAIRKHGFRVVTDYKILNDAKVE
jgi:predicted polyphosphate/ATP-dependent NAD kinase